MILLGSTGSIGVNTLKIAKEFNLNIEVLVAGKNIELLNKQIIEHKPKIVIIQDKNDIFKVKNINNKILAGEEAILNMIKNSESNLVVNALVGFLGLKPTLTAIQYGKKVALANKESLVTAGSFIDMSKIIPIDSEHFGLKYLLQEDKEISKMTITASGGAFRDRKFDDLKDVKLQDVLKHPNWSMGTKITIDSATMVNKLFEVLEARWLFNTTNIDAIIETKSLIHAFVDFKDGSTVAHFANADMRLPIAYALMGTVNKEIINHIDIQKLSNLEFRKITSAQYPIWELKDEVLKNPKSGLVVNALNEVAIQNFLNKKGSFQDISKTILKGYEKFYLSKIDNIDDIFGLDKEIRDFFKIG